MIKDRIAIDLPAYEGLLAGHFQRGQGYGRRREGGTDDWLLIMTLSGEGRIGTVRGDLPARAGELYLIAPGTTHDYGTARRIKEWEILWVHFHPPTSWLEFLNWPEAAPGIGRLSLPCIPPRPLRETLADSDSEEFHAEGADGAATGSVQSQIEEAFQEVIRQSVSPGRLRPAFGLNALEKLLLLCEASRPAGPDLLDERIRAAIEFIHSHLNEPIRLGHLSRLCHLSESRFAHLFRKAVGLAPAQYMLVQRLQRAQTLLGRTSMGVAEVAAEVGMDPYYLSLRFKRETGHSPREYRAAHAKRVSVTFADL